MPEPFHGVLPALITPFTDDGGAIDEHALAAIVDRLVGAGVGGLVPGGSTGEFTTLTTAERRRLVEITVEAADGRVPVVAGTGALDQFVGKSGAGSLVVKTNIDAVSGATVTTKGITKGANAALAAAEAMA